RIRRQLPARPCDLASLLARDCGRGLSVVIERCPGVRTRGAGLREQPWTIPPARFGATRSAMGQECPRLRPADHLAPVCPSRAGAAVIRGPAPVQPLLVGAISPK